MADNSFFTLVFQEILNSITNNYNYEIDNLGDEKFNFSAYLKNKFIYKKFINKYSIREIRGKFKEVLLDNESGFWWLYNNLSDKNSKKVLIEIICYRILGHTMYKLPLDNKFYWEEKRHIEINKKNKIFLNQNHKNTELFKYDLRFLNYNIDLYCSPLGVQATFCLDQYHYKADNIEIYAESNDVVIDAGACYGDTSLYFASKIGKMGTVYSFEFIPSNLNVFNKNIEMNPQFKSNIILCKQPLSDVCDAQCYFLDYGPGSILLENEPKEYDGTAKTVTIDSFINSIDEKKVDFIKMDIEGSELKALIGAERVIRKHKPKLAISVYHNLEDFYKIPGWIESLNLGYKFYLGHFSTHKEETVLFAKI